EAVLAREVARAGVADFAGPARVARAALTVHAAAVGRAAVRTVRVGVDADAVAVHERLRARQRAVAAVADVAGVAGDPGAALSVLTAALGGAAVAPVALPIDAHAAAVDELTLAGERARPVGADVARVTGFTRVASVETATFGGAAIAPIGVGVDAGVAAANQALGTRERARPIGADLTRAADRARRALAGLPTARRRAAVAAIG